jgi:hypothetical protein
MRARRGMTVVLAALAGCAAEPAPRPVRPLAAPRVAAEVRYFGGAPLAGPGAAAPAAAGDPAQALEIVASFLALEDLPEEALGPLGGLARAFASAEDAHPLSPAGRLAAGARAGPVVEARSFVGGLLLGDFGRATRIADVRAALPRGVTAVFEATRAGAPQRDAAPAREALGVAVYRPPSAEEDALEIALDLEVARPTSAPPASGRRREIALLERLPVADFALIAPSPFSGDEARAIAVVIAARPAPAGDAPDAAAHRDALAACAADLARADELARRRAEPPAAAALPTAAPPDPAAVLASGALADPKRRRAALLALAQAGAAPLAEDLALAGTDALVATATATLASEAAPGEELGWQVERAALDAVAAATAGAEEGVLRPIDVLLLRRAGALGLLRESLFEAVGAASGLADLERRIETANRELLEDADPGLRVRAFEWLSARGRAPAGFDPLGPANARRKALEQ